MGFGDLWRRAINSREIRSTENYCRGAQEQAHSLGNLGSPRTVRMHQIAPFL